MTTPQPNLPASGEVALWLKHVSAQLDTLITLNGGGQPPAPETGLIELVEPAVPGTPGAVSPPTEDTAPGPARTRTRTRAGKA